VSTATATARQRREARTAQAPSATSRWRAADSMLWPWLAATVGATLLFAIAWVRFATFHSGGYDLAFFDQVVWNGSQGNGLGSTYLSYPFLGQHFEPALFLFAPLYRLHATPLWLLGAQSLALGVAVVPLWALARRWLGGGLRPAVVCAAYLLQVGIARAAGFDFHTEALAVPFVFLALLGAARDDTRLLLLAGLVPLLCKEDGALVSLGIAVIALAVHRRRAGAVLGAVAIAGGALIVFAVMPAIRGGAPGDLVSRYAYLGDSPASILLHLVTQPGTWLRHLVSPPAGPALLVALAAVGFLPLLRPIALLAAAPALLLALLAGDAYQGGLRLHYGLQATPLLLCAAMLGWQRVDSLLRRYRAPHTLPAAALLGGAVATWIALSPLPGGHGPDSVGLQGLERAAAVDALLARIPPDASVSATPGLLTHLAERPFIVEFPTRRSPQWIAVDGDAAEANRLPARGYVMAGDAWGVTLWRRAIPATS
jgi:uncharacterized membrane protein